MWWMMWLAQPGLAQTTSIACSPSASVRDDLRGGNVVIGLTVLGFAEASSVRLPEGPTSDLPDPTDTPSYMLDDLESCTYGAGHVVDSDPDTAWIADGPAVGEVVLVPLPHHGPFSTWRGELQIRAGYARSPAHWRAYARPREVEVFLVGRGCYQGGEVDGYSDLLALGRHTIELDDVDAWQPLPLPEWGPRTLVCTRDDELQEPAYIALRIVSSTPGTLYDATALSELRRWPAR